MALRAVIFDYGKVLSALPDVDAHTSLVTATGLEDAAFEDHYWAHRHAYDAGELNSRTYWQKIAQEAGFSLDEGQLADIIAHDCRMWGNLNQSMVDWALSLMAKPDIAIYHHTLEKLGVAPEEALFIDDIQRNIDAASSIGIHAILFTEVAALRTELVARKLDAVLPLPELA